MNGGGLGTTALDARHADLRPLGGASVALAALAGVLAAAFLHGTGAAPGLGAALACAAPGLLALAAAASSRADRRQYVARCMAVVVMAPILLAMWAGSQPGTASALRTGLLGGAALAGLGLAWAALFLWAARVATRLEPAAGTAPVDADRLRARLQSLPAAGWPLAWAASASGDDWTLDLRVADDGRRWHRVRLRPDRRRHAVHVLEELGAGAAAPQTAAEASMQGPGEPSWDPTRPAAQRLSSRVRQTTQVDPAAMAGLELQLEGDRVLPPPRLPDGVLAGPAERRGELLVTLLAMLVTRSGWVWQPALRRPPAGD